MGQFLEIRDGGKTSESGAMRFLRQLSSNSQGPVGQGLIVGQHSSPNKSVDIPIGDIVIAYQDYCYYAWNTDSPYNLAITSNTSGNPRIDVVVAYIDLSVVASASNNNPGALKFMAVLGTPAGSPVAPNGTAIQAAVGAGNPYVILPNGIVAVANGYTSIVTANLSGPVAPFAIGSNPGYILGIPATILAINNDQSLNPPCKQAQTFTRMAVYAGVPPVGSVLTIRIYNQTQAQEVGSVSITSGSHFGSNISLAHPSVNQDDILQLDVTAIGSGTPGGKVTAIIY